jgi:23S rRNA (adenine2503-C2)-methyltransferase
MRDVFPGRNDKRHKILDARRKKLLEWGLCTHNDQGLILQPDTKASFLNQTPESMREIVASWSEPTYRAQQVFEWVFAKGVFDYSNMTNLPKLFRERLAREFALLQGEVIREEAARDGTTKRLLRWGDGTTSECVLIPDQDRRTVCISTQVGCPAGCRFCASGVGGLQRQLSAGEIIEQALQARLMCGSERLTNVVFMGIGEPLANYEATVRAVRALNASWGLGIGARRITVSTVGLPARMRKLADEGLQITLALSLHAPTDDLRRELIPWAERVTIAELVDAACYYFDRTGREVTLEYILLGGVNDSVELARQLAALTNQMRANVNLIAYNPVDGMPYERPREDDVRRFLSTLRDRGVNAHVRRSRGLDIDAACGQLRRREQGNLTTIHVEEMQK